MAKEEETTQSVPALVDYGGSSDVDDDRRWTSNNVSNYWKKINLAHHSTGGVLISLKDRALFKKLLEEFEIQDLLAMITLWITSNKVKEAVNVGYFYHQRYDVFDKVKPKDYTDWLT